LEKKNTGKIWVCIHFHNLNKATHKDEYPMPIANMLINNAFGHQMISFLKVPPMKKEATPKMQRSLFKRPTIKK
jgi:hypothetical protein